MQVQSTEQIVNAWPSVSSAVSDPGVRRDKTILRKSPSIGINVKSVNSENSLDTLQVMQAIVNKTKEINYCENTECASINSFHSALSKSNNIIDNTSIVSEDINHSTNMSSDNGTIHDPKEDNDGATTSVMTGNQNIFKDVRNENQPVGTCDPKEKSTSMEIELDLTKPISNETVVVMFQKLMQNMVDMKKDLKSEIQTLKAEKNNDMKVIEEVKITQSSQGQEINELKNGYDHCKHQVNRLADVVAFQN